MKCAFRLALITVISFAAASGAVDQEKSWVGERVQNTKPSEEIHLGDRVGDKQVSFPFSGIMPITVREDREGRLRIHDGHREGWVDKANFVLVHDAPAYFQHRIQANPNDTWALYMRGSGLRQKGEPDNAIKDFDEHIRLDPTSSAGYSGRGNAWYDKKDYDRAIADYKEAIRRNAKDAISYVNRGLAWHAKQDYDKAIADYDEAIRLDAKFASAYFNRGLVLHGKKEYEKAIADYNEAIRRDPKYVRAYSYRAWLWATSPDPKFRDGKKAVESAKAALVFDPKDAYNMQALAAAYAETGDFVEAVHWQERALEDSRLKNDKVTQRRLELYRNKQRYPEE